MSKTKILIVDDKEENIYLLRTLLEANGYEVDDASNGEEALEKARKNLPDMFISDILMPVMDGFALCRECKKDPALKPIPFAFYTATYTEDRDQDFALSLGAERFIVKPQEPEILVELIRGLLSERRDNKETVQRAETKPYEQPYQYHEQDSVYLKQYNETLVRKLITKMEQLEQTNLELEKDIAARKVAEEALRESEERFRSLVDVAPEAIYVQHGGVIIFANPATVKLFGAASAGDLLNMAIMDRVAPESRDKVLERIRFQKETGKPVPPMDQVYLRLDGTRVPVETTAVYVRYNRLDSHLVFVRDITERKRVEEEKAKLEAQLRQAQKMEAVGHLAGGVAHDFNNLLQVINGYTQIMLMSPSCDPTMRSQLEQVNQAGNRAANLTRQLLTFSRREVQQPKILNINTIVADMEKMLRRLIRESIILETRLDPDLKMIKADPGHVEQVIMNLAVNARDAMMPAGGNLIISTRNIMLDVTQTRKISSNIRPGNHVRLSVTDSGCGMTEETMSHIFEPFFTTKEEGKGTGLGLATVYGIVNQSKGFIDVESEPGKGTTFHIYFPPVMEKDSIPGTDSASSSMPGGNETILLVEDQENVRNLVMEMLKSVGYLVVPTSSGAEALEAAKQLRGPIHLLLTDIVMPGMNGLELSKKLGLTSKDLKTLYMSGYIDDVNLKEMKNCTYIQKPITMGELSRKVREILDKGKA